MPSYDPELFNVDPYYDDFDQTKKYLKLLFRPGFSLQARELSQIQTILQNQIERFGNFVFDDGSIVYGGQITEIPTRTAYLEALTGAGVGAVDLKDVVIELKNNSTGLTSYAKIIHGMKEVTSLSEKNVVYFQYLVGEGQTANGLAVLGTYGGLTFSATMTGQINDSLVIFVDDGVRYSNGYFVSHDAQRIGLYNRNGDTYTYSGITASVGFDVVKQIITAEDDETLKDPANGSYNFNAPGADRFKIDLQIAQRSLTASEENVVTDPFSRTDFIEFLRVAKGQVVKKEKYADLGSLEDTLARRTYDESGNYIVDPFELSVQANSDPTKLDFKLDSGKAYILGYEFETQSPVKLLNVPKSRTTLSSGRVELDQRVGPYILVKFTGYSGSAMGMTFGGLSSQNPNYYPTVIFDSYGGYPFSQVFDSSLNGVAFTINSLVDVGVFTPGTTMYFSTVENTFTGPSRSEIYSTIRTVQTFSRGLSGETPVSYTKVEVGPPFSYGYSGNNTTFSGGFTGAFTQQNLFYVSGGTAFEAGITSNVFEVNSSSVSLFTTGLEESLTGGSLVNSIGSARVKNVQRFSSDIYKLFVTDISMDPEKPFSEIRRLFVGTRGTVNVNPEPVFFAYEASPTVYDTEADTLVFPSRNPTDVVEKFTSTLFAFDMMRGFSNQSDFESAGGSVVGNELTLGSGFLPSSTEEWGLNFSTNDVPISLGNSNFITVFDADGDLGGTYKLQGSSPSKPDTLVLNLDRAPKYPLWVNTSHIVDSSIGSNRTKKKSAVTNATLSNNLLVYQGSGVDSGYWIADILSSKSPNKHVTDVYEITYCEITDAGVTADITSEVILDSGQRDMYYDFSRIKTRRSLASITDCKLSYKRFVGVSSEDVYGQGPFLGQESYYDTNGSTKLYEEIPSFTRKNGEIVELRNSVDFRPVRVGNRSTFTLMGPYDDLTGNPRIRSSHASSGYDNVVEYDFYLPRIDKVFLTKDKRFVREEGIPSPSPQSPPDNPDFMTLYSVVLNPFTFDENDVVVKQENNRRYTMKDIGELERRIEKIEYYSTLNALEQEAKAHPIYDDFGIEVPKKAILVDQFNNSSSADVLGEEVACSIEKDKKELRPSFTLYEKSAIGASGSLDGAITFSNGLTHAKNMTTLVYNTQEYVSNKLANSSRKVNSNSIIDYIGSLTLSPHCDRWFSVTKSPFIKTNYEGENDSWYSPSPFTSNANFWDYNWFGKEVNEIEKNFKKTKPNRSFDARKTDIVRTTKIGNFSSSQANIQNSSQRTIEKSISPYVRARRIYFQAEGLKPLTKHYLFFDDIAVNSSGGGNNQVTTDNNGKASGYFSISSDVFQSGKKLVRLVDTQSGLSSTTSSSADANYVVSGTPKDSDSFRYTRSLITKREASNSNNITTNALTRSFQRSENKSKSLKDSLTQVFSVDYQAFKNGIYVKKMDIYFDEYPSSASSDIGSIYESKLPVRLQLKPIVNGYPSSSKVIAESYKYLMENEATISPFTEDIPTVKKATFEFDYPIYLEPGDYAVSLDSNSDKYSVVTYVLPSIQKEEQVTNKNSAISSLFGSLFLPKNIGSFEKISNEFLTMTIHRCEFSNTTSSITMPSGVSQSTIVNDMRVNYEASIPPSTSVLVKVDNKTLPANKTVEYDRTQADEIVLEFNTTDGSVSPCLDLETLNLVYNKYKMAALNFSDELSVRSSDNSASKSKYFTKTVKLNSPATNVVVRFEKIEPPQTQISVFVKYISPGSSKTIDEVPYVRLSPSEQSGLKTNKDVFVTDEYKYVGGLNEIASFVVKIVFSSQSGVDVVNYPKIRNLTVTAI